MRGGGNFDADMTAMCLKKPAGSSERPAPFKAIVHRLHAPDTRIPVYFPQGQS
jgi:hypothetical protein